ncbi:MAG: histidine kinase [Burkholderiaceae bacterium]|nr:histidine kinase [Burkholderiaceae bacterium]
MSKSASRPLSARIHWYWVCQLGGWGLLGLSDMAVNLRLLDRPGMVIICWWTAATGMLLSMLWRHALHRLRWAGAAPHWGKLALPILLLACTETLLVYAAIAHYRPFGPIEGYNWLNGAMVFWIGIYMVWTLLYFSVQSMRRATRLEAQALQLEVAAKDAELRALQAQINPHFFFNSLNSMRALMYEDRDAAALMIDRMACLMRYALQSGANGTVPLAAELEVVQAYLAIEQIRFEERLRATVTIEPGLEQVCVPPMSLQTLVENAVKYGVETSASGSDIAVHASRQPGAIRIEVANTGALRSTSPSTRVGLQNARKRLALAVGPNATLDLQECDGWVQAVMILPEAA